MVAGYICGIFIKFKGHIPVIAATVPFKITKMAQSSVTNCWEND